MQSIIASNEILLERISEVDASAIFEAVDTYRDWLAKWLPFVSYTKELKDTEAFIASIIEKRDETGNEVYVIWYKGDFAGLISFLNTDKVNEKTELGYWLVQKFTHKGILISCVSSLVELAFEKMMMNRVTIRCATENTPSENVALRLGFKFEGIERQGEKCMDQFLDLKVFSLLRDEFQYV